MDQRLVLNEQSGVLEACALLQTELLKDAEHLGSQIAPLIMEGCREEADIAVALITDIRSFHRITDKLSDLYRNWQKREPVHIELPMLESSPVPEERIVQKELAVEPPVTPVIVEPEILEPEVLEPVNAQPLTPVDLSKQVAPFVPEGWNGKATLPPPKKVRMFSRNIPDWLKMDPLAQPQDPELAANWRGPLTPKMTKKGRDLDSFVFPVLKTIYLNGALPPHQMVHEMSKELPVFAKALHNDPSFVAKVRQLLLKYHYIQNQRYFWVLTNQGLQYVQDL